MPRGLPTSNVQPYRRFSALPAEVRLPAAFSPTGNVQPYQQWCWGVSINLGYLSPMRSVGNMLGKHLLNDRIIPMLSPNYMLGKHLPINRGFSNALAGELDGEAATK